MMFLMMPCNMLLSAHMRNIRSIDLLGRGKGRVSGLRDAI